MWMEIWNYAQDGDLSWGSTGVRIDDTDTYIDTGF